MLVFETNPGQVEQWSNCRMIGPISIDSAVSVVENMTRTRKHAEGVRENLLLKQWALTVIALQVTDLMQGASCHGKTLWVLPQGPCKTSCR